jgi:hypothetical protein
MRHHRFEPLVVDLRHVDGGVACRRVRSDIFDIPILGILLPNLGMFRQEDPSELRHFEKRLRILGSDH